MNPHRAKEVLAPLSKKTKRNSTAFLVVLFFYLKEFEGNEKQQSTRRF
jgi:hypothetical protein